MKNIFGAISKEGKFFKISFSKSDVFLLNLNFNSESNLNEFYSFIKDNIDKVLIKNGVSDEELTLNDFKFKDKKTLQEFVKIFQDKKIGYDSKYKFNFGKIISSLE